MEPVIKNNSTFYKDHLFNERKFFTIAHIEFLNENERKFFTIAHIEFLNETDAALRKLALATEF